MKIKFKDVDIATIEIIHDKLFELGEIKATDKLHENYLNVMDKMRAVRDITIKRKFEWEELEVKKYKNILEESANIIYNRGQEKEREYGPIDESIERAAKFAELISGQKVSPNLMFKCLIALKLSRLAYNHKHDTYLDAITYLTMLYEYEKKIK